MSEQITSRRNPLMTHLRKLRDSRSYRRQVGEYLGDGVKLLDEALRWGAPLTLVVTTADHAHLAPTGARHVVVPEDVMISISPMETPQGALFTCRLPQLALPRRLEGRRYLVLEGLQDPGNVGTIWRTADAFGADGLILTKACADPYGHKTVRASMGAAFRLPVWEGTEEEVRALLARHEIPLYATALRADTADIRRADLSRCAVVIGSEGKGVSGETLAQCAGTLKIPMRERCESLNAAIAAGLVLWEMARND